jgi:hypothetical protein
MIRMNMHDPGEGSNEHKRPRHKLPWQHTALLAILLVGWLFTPARAQDDGASRCPDSATASAPAVTSVGGWAFNCFAEDASIVFVQAGVPTANVERVRRAMSMAAVSVPWRLDTTPPGRLDYFVFRSKEDFLRGVHQLGGVAGSSDSINGYSRSGGPHPGTYYNGAAQDEDAPGVWTVAHEYAHQIESRLALGRPIPQWFNEGVADYLAGLTVKDHYPDYYAARDYVSGARIANAGRLGVLPTLAFLDTHSAWIAARPDEATVYDSARLLIGQLVERRGLAAVTDTLSLLGSGVPFDTAFERAFGVSPTQADADLGSYAAAILGTPPAFQRP